MSAPVPPVTPESNPTTAPLSPPAPSGGTLKWVLRVLIATVIVVVAVAGYVYLNEKPPVAIGQVTNLYVYPVHRVNNAGGGLQGMVGVEQKFDQVILVAQVHLHNQSQGPLFVFDMFGNLSLPGQNFRSLAATATDFNRVFIAYPEIAAMKQPPILRNSTIPAGSDLDGELVLNFPITKEQWDQRQSMSVTIQFTHQKDLILQAPK